MLNCICDVVYGILLVCFQILTTSPKRMLLHSEIKVQLHSYWESVFMIERLEYIVVQIENETL